MAILKDGNNSSVFFYSYSHGLDGLSGADGTAVKITFDEIENLNDFLLSFHQSCGISMICQFEMQPMVVACKSEIPMDCAGTVNKEIHLMDKYFQCQKPYLCDVQILMPERGIYKERNL